LTTFCHETFVETIILNWSFKFILNVATFGLDASSYECCCTARSSCQ